jgi:tripartite-type tricarboxylate transporter receptor subunit TctC
MGLVGPAKLPAPITTRLNAEMNALIAEPVMVEKIHALGSDPKGGKPDDFKALIASDIARWTKVIADANIERI